MTPFPLPVHPYMPEVILHIAAGCFAIVAGYTALFAAKGEWLHRSAGKAFVAAMLVTASVAVYLAVSLRGSLPGQIPNIAGGSLAFYLVLSAYVTVMRKEGTVGWWEKIAVLIPLALGGLFLAWGIEAANSPGHAFDGYQPPLFFVFSAISVFCAALDARMLVRGGLTGVARIARHLWRMCGACFFATGSFFLGQQKVMPVWIHGSKALIVLGLAPLAFLLFWIVRVRIGTRFKSASDAG